MTETKSQVCKRLWASLADVPVNEDEEILEDWNEFSRGTPREDVWHWFEERFEISVASLMGLTRKE